VILLHSSFRQRSLKSKAIGFFHAVSGAKSEDGPDDDVLNDGGGGRSAADEENPSPNGTTAADLSRLSASRGANDELLSQQARDRSAFRANMRAKYLKKT
jgi:hypothetical protein